MLENGKIIRCHQDQLRKCFIDENIRVKEQPLLSDDELTMFPDNVTRPEVTYESAPTLTERRYPSRPRRPPAQYQEQQMLKGKRCSNLTIYRIYICHNVIVRTHDML